MQTLVVILLMLGLLERDFVVSVKKRKRMRKIRKRNQRMKSKWSVNRAKSSEWVKGITSVLIVFVFLQGFETPNYK